MTSQPPCRKAQAKVRLMTVRKQHTITHSVSDDGYGFFRVHHQTKSERIILTSNKVACVVSSCFSKTNFAIIRLFIMEHKLHLITIFYSLFNLLYFKMKFATSKQN